MKPLRKLCKLYCRKELPLLAWTPSQIQLFKDLKVSVTSGPILARCDPSRPTFLKTDWSAEGMGWILMQPANDDESLRAIDLLCDTGECLFDLCKNGARLRPIAFGSRACTDMERKLHSFLGEVASERWAISQNKRFLWGCHFYWLCGCSAVKEVIECEGSISHVCCWSQELLGYHFDCVHRHNRMMIDVDSLTRRHGKMIAQHMAIAYALRELDESSRPAACTKDAFNDLHLKKLPQLDPSNTIFTDSTIWHACLHVSADVVSHPPSPHSIPCLTTSPLHVCDNVALCHDTNDVDDSMKSFERNSPLLLSALVIDDTTSTSNLWFQDFTVSAALWNIRHAYTAIYLQNFHAWIHNSECATNALLTGNSLTNVQGELASSSFIDWTCSMWKGLGIDWIQHVMNVLIPVFIDNQSKLQICLLWIPSPHCHGISEASVATLLRQSLPAQLHFTCACECATRWGENVDLRRFLITVACCNTVSSCKEEFQPRAPKCIFDKLDKFTLH